MLLFVIPLDGNPYQELLYKPMRAAHGDSFRTLFWLRRRWIGIPQFFPLALWAAIRGSQLAHIHWLAWDVRANIPMRKTLSGLISRAAIFWLRLLRFHIVWTVHDVVPHEEQTNNDTALGQLLSRHTDVMIMHSAITLEALKGSQWTVRSSVVIPQGSYVGRYGLGPTSEMARQSLGLPDSGRVLLFFGLIRPYKGIPELLTTWKNSHPEGILLIAGQCSDSQVRSLIFDAARQDPKIHAHLRYIPDSDVSTYFAAADVGCFPFLRITNSSSALLALSFGKPIIAPRIGALADLPDEVGFWYGGNTGSTLSGAIEQFLGVPEETLVAYGTSAYSYAESLSWPTIAEKTHRVYEGVLGHFGTITNS